MVIIWIIAISINLIVWVPALQIGLRRLKGSQWMHDVRQSLHDSPFADFDWLAEEDSAYWHETFVEGWDDE